MEKGADSPAAGTVMRKSVVPPTIRPASSRNTEVSITALDSGADLLHEPSLLNETLPVIVSPPNELAYAETSETSSEIGIVTRRSLVVAPASSATSTLAVVPASAVD